MHQELLDAITNREVICFYYESLLREVEPHCYGKNPKGETVMWGFQTGGQSKSGRVPCWRLFDAARMQNLYLAGRKFPGPREAFPKNCPPLNPVLAQVPPSPTQDLIPPSR